MTEVERLNKYLAGLGKSIDGRTLYRITWSDSALENRYGTFREFTESGLFIREVTETRLTKKYNYIRERWIFEKWAPGELTAHRETPDAMSGDYIPVYVFEDSKGKYLPPTEKSVTFIVDFLLGRIRKEDQPSQEYLDAKEVEYQVESMDDGVEFDWKKSTLGYGSRDPNFRKLMGKINVT